MPGTTFNILVLGDSAAWGQGLQPRDKFHSLVAAAIRAGNPTLTVPDPVVRAHSGASVLFDPPGRKRFDPSPPGEVPTTYPKVVEQCQAYVGPPDKKDVDLILVNGGANDVELTTILNPYTSAATVGSLVNNRVYPFWKEHLLPCLLGTFTNARIVVIGYYPIVSDLTSTYLLEKLCVAYFSWPVWLAALAGAPFVDALKQQVYENCRTFAWGARNVMHWAAEETGAAWNRAIYYADPYVGAGFNENHSIFTSDPWVFGVGGAIPFLTVEDTVTSRPADCQRAYSDDPANWFTCNLASAGHPNPRGARAYADAILAALYAPRLVVSVTPAQVPFDVPTTVVVSAVRFDNRAPVSGTVRVRNFDAFGRAVYQERPTGAPFTATFRTGFVRQFDPETRTWGAEETEPGGVVLATGYPTAKVPFTWAY